MIIFPDLELFLTDWLRNILNEDVFVSNRLVDHDHKFSVIVRDDSGVAASVRAERRIAVIVVGENMQATSELARKIAALIAVLPSRDEGNPVAAVQGVYGPYRRDLPDPSITEYHLTAELVIVGATTN